jgi:hypothetical protein
MSASKVSSVKRCKSFCLKSEFSKKDAKVLASKVHSVKNKKVYKLISRDS